MSFVEKTFLGSLMEADFLIKDTVIQPDQLESTIHKELMRRMLDLHREGKNTDLITLTTLLDLDSFGGVSYLSELVAFADIEKFEECEGLILETWKKRETKNILTKAAVNEWDIEQVIASLDTINQVKVNDHTSIEHALLAIYEAPWQEQKEQVSATTGIKQLDKFTGGFQDGEVTILAARPSMGKTDVMLHFAKAAGWANYVPVVFSLEMPLKLITSRLVASTGGFNRVKMRDPKNMLNQVQKEKWMGVITHLNKTNLQVFDGAGQKVSEMRAKVRKVMNDFPTKKPVIFIDYLTLIQSSEVYGGNAHFQVTEISRNLKMMAKDFECPVVCLAQLNRSVESRVNKRPMMSDIRESGSVEQDADVILFLYREKYYDKDTDDTSLELIITKNRNGPVGTVMVSYNEHTGEIGEFPKNTVGQFVS
ncbi:DnaB helicase C-terminal domain-containing protein [Fredinandcohnia sp. 179-A 10B2 NHS]|uniref:DnaB helicase C-terminal domain-containing protein n=1 Tax=Fredinandcohnia sp. 179-A 10B2 NHS TaxID=3235176 RepID=UPI0039A2B5CB